MAQGEVVTTIVGNLTAVELRFTPGGVAIAKFSIAATPRVLNKDTGEWGDGTPLFMPCTAWRDLADHIGESLEKGHRVIAQGRLRQEEWQDKDTGAKRSRVTMEVDEIGPSLRFAFAKPTKAPSQSGGGFDRGAQAGAPTGGPTRTANFDDEVPF